ncbi:MAG: flagellar export protein FliJ [Vicinamibacterales bacterium]
MRPFRFRAEGALELRRKREDDARLVLTRAQNVAAVAETSVVSARAALDDAGSRLSSIQTQGAPIWLIDWHRSWILKRTRELDTCRQRAATAHAVVAQATGVLNDAHKKRRVLERLRDRLAARHAREADRQELAQMNELATMRYLMARRDIKEQV